MGRMYWKERYKNWRDRASEKKREKAKREKILKRKNEGGK